MKVHDKVKILIHLRFDMLAFLIWHRSLWQG